MNRIGRNVRHTWQVFMIAVLLTLLAAPAAHAAERPPNVILFLVDDMGWRDCGVYGSRYYETPHIDQFATQAMRFTDAYAQPLCSPTRASLLTGKYSARHGVTSASGHQPPQPPGASLRPETAAPGLPVISPQSRNYLEPSEITLAETLRAAGYRTAHLGKWHLGLTPPYWPEQQGFDTAFHCHPDPGPPGNYFSPYGVSADGAPSVRHKVGTITDGPDGEYIVDRLADEAVRFLRENRDRPFFLNLWQYGVHGPWGHKEEYTKQFTGKKDPDGAQGNPIMASMLKSVDESFGRILAELDRLNLREQTLVIFNSDNGGNTHSNTSGDGKAANRQAAGQLGEWSRWAGDRPPTSNAPLRDGKGTLYEGGTRVPLMWSWPGKIPAGGTNDTVVGHIDVYPTVLDLLDIARPADQIMDGVSYAQVLLGHGELQREAFFNYFPHLRNSGGVWVRAGHMKLIRWFDPGLPRELYDLQQDLSETKNLAEAQPETVRQLDALIDQFLTRTGALLPIPNPAYRGAAARPGKAVAGPASDDGTGPIAGWKLRGIRSTPTRDGVLLDAVGPTPFLGTARFRFTDSAELRLRVKSATGGVVAVHWRTANQAEFDSAAQVAEFEIPAGTDWQEIRVQVPARGDVVQLRLYLPADRGAIELATVEVKSAKATPRER